MIFIQQGSRKQGHVQVRLVTVHCAFTQLLEKGIVILR